MDPLVYNDCVSELSTDHITTVSHTREKDTDWKIEGEEVFQKMLQRGLEIKTLGSWGKWRTRIIRLSRTKDGVPALELGVGHYPTIRWSIKKFVDVANVKNVRWCEEEKHNKLVTIEINNCKPWIIKFSTDNAARIFSYRLRGLLKGMGLCVIKDSL
jgi:hypothetical protein